MVANMKKLLAKNKPSKFHCKMIWINLAILALSVAIFYVLRMHYVAPAEHFINKVDYSVTNALTGMPNIQERCSPECCLAGKGTGVSCDRGCVCKAILPL
jgi:hypothetical protein